MSIETEDWKLRVRFDWEPKYKTVECPTCHGQGKVGGGFKSLDGPEQCKDCFGRGNIEQYPKTPTPEIPLDAREYMRRAWYDFTHR